jgi:hypothetical protein
VLRESGSDGAFPASELNRTLARTGRSAAFDATLANFLDISYGDREAFLALSLLYVDRRWGSTQHHQDHIFPRSLFTPARLASSGLSAEQQMRYRTLVDRIGNLQLLTAQENLEKLNKPFEDWLSTRHDSARARHLIPTDHGLYSFDRFEEFVTAREDLIRHRLRNLLAGSDAADEQRLA